MKWYSYTYSLAYRRVRVLLTRSTSRKNQGKSLANASGWDGDAAHWRIIEYEKPRGIAKRNGMGREMRNFKTH